MTEFAQALSQLREGPATSLSDDDFVTRVMGACARQPDPQSSPRRRVLAAAGTLLAAAAAGALVLRRDRFSARGVPQSGSGASVQAFVARSAPGVPPALLEHAELRPGDGILVRYANPTAERSFLMVFALDQRGDVHWLHPAYLSENEDPSSLELAPHTSWRALDEVAEPESPAPGPLRIYALLSPEPLHVKEVEARLAGEQRPVSALFAELEVEEWRCTWRAR